MSVAIAPMASRARLDHHVISRAHRTARVRSHYLSPPSPVIPRGALPAAKGPRKVRRFPAPPMPATRRAADPSADACVWTDTEETCAVKSKALNTEQCGVPDDAGVRYTVAVAGEASSDVVLFVARRRSRQRKVKAARAVELLEGEDARGSPSAERPSLRKRLTETFDGLAAAVSPRPRDDSHSPGAEDLAALSRALADVAADHAPRRRP